MVFIDGFDGLGAVSVGGWRVEADGGGEGDDGEDEIAEIWDLGLCWVIFGFNTLN
jgi:hypothetical protein